MRRLSACSMVLSLAALLAAGCSSYELTMPTPDTELEIVLKENDFQTVQTNLKGSASCSYILGMPLGNSSVASEAEKELRSGLQMDGRSVQLVNWTKDETVMDLLIYKRHKITLTADAIEFK